MKEENKIALNYCRMRMWERLLREAVGLWVDQWDARIGRRNEDSSSYAHKSWKRSSPYSPDDEYPPSPFFLSPALLYTYTQHTQEV